MKTLVTGATGLLGNNIVRDLLARGEQVRVITRGSGVTPPLEGLDVEIVRGDVCDPEAIRKAMSGVQLVIHSAGHVHIGWSQAELHESVNVEGTRNVARAAHEQGARMVYVSSVNALGVGGRDFEASEENARPEVVPCPYVTSKAHAEELVQDFVRQGLSGITVNPAFMLGPWDWKPSSGRMMLEVTRRFTPLGPSGSFNVCDVRDVSAGTIAAAKIGRPGRRYILGGHNLRYIELWQRMAKVAGRRGPLMPAGPLLRNIGGWWGDLRYRMTGREPELNSAGVRMSSQHHRFTSKRAIAELGYTIRPLEQTLQDAWEWFVAHGYVRR